MKKLITPLPAGGMPVQLEDVLNLQNVNHDAFKQFLYGIGNFFVLSGVEIITQDTNLNTVSMSEGWVWMSDEIRYVPAYQGAYPYFIKNEIDTFTKKTMADGTSKNVYVYKSATSVTARPANYPYIECTPAPFWVAKNMITSKVMDALNAEIATRQAQITQETYDRKAAVGALYLALGALSDIVQTKVTRKIARVEWTDLDLSTGGAWMNTTNYGYNTPQYMRTEDGFVHLRGTLMQVITGGGLLASLPSGFAPLKNSRIMIRDSNGTYDVQIDIATQGIFATVLRAPSNYKAQISIDSISFYADGPGGVI